MTGLRLRAVALAMRVQQSYWFVPGLFALAGVGLALAAVAVDARLGHGWIGAYQWLAGSRPEGARQMLATIAGSTITVAGVVFSVTLAAVTYASGQHGPRLLTNFVRDRGNQVTIGVFLGTFLYCLVVLRTVRGGGEVGAGGARWPDVFVPDVALYGALLLALASIAVLVYFLHHVTDGIDINRVIARIGRRTIDDIDAAARRRRGEQESAPIPTLVGLWTDVASHGTGYLAAVDHAALCALAAEDDAIVELRCHPGDFVARGEVVLRVSPPLPLDYGIDRRCNAALSLTDQRSDVQDVRFGLDELVEIAVRALSPGVNDPFTAHACVDWLGAALSELSRAPPARRVYADSQGDARLIARPPDFEDMLAATFSRLRTYAAGDPNVSRQVIAVLEAVAHASSDPLRGAAARAERSRWVDAQRTDTTKAPAATEPGRPTVVQQRTAPPSRPATTRRD